MPSWSAHTLMQSVVHKSKFCWSNQGLLWWWSSMPLLHPQEAAQQGVCTACEGKEGCRAEHH